MGCGHVEMLLILTCEGTAELWCVPSGCPPSPGTKISPPAAPSLFLCEAPSGLVLSAGPHMAEPLTTFFFYFGMPNVLCHVTVCSRTLFNIQCFLTGVFLLASSAPFFFYCFTIFKDNLPADLHTCLCRSGAQFSLSCIFIPYVPLSAVFLLN